MLIFGTASKTVQHPIDQYRVLLLTYRYFHIFWLLRAAFGKRYTLATSTQAGWAHQPISEQEAASMIGGELPKPTFWDQWSLLCGLVVILVGVVTPLAFGH